MIVLNIDTNFDISTMLTSQSSLIIYHQTKIY